MKVLVLPLLLLLLAACEKRPFDYRNKYLGDWEFEVQVTEFMGSEVQYTIIRHKGCIQYGSEKDRIEILYLPNESIELQVSKNGNLSDFPTSYCSGDFENRDNLYLYLRWGGLGGGVIHEIEGTK